jgi:hypothetical protein
LATEAVPEINAPDASFGRARLPENPPVRSRSLGEDFSLRADAKRFDGVFYFLEIVEPTFADLVVRENVDVFAEPGIGESNAVRGLFHVSKLRIIHLALRGVSKEHGMNERRRWPCGKFRTSAEFVRRKHPLKYETGFVFRAEECFG